MRLHGHRARTRPTAAVRRRKRLVQIQVHHVDAEVTRPRDTHQRVHVRAIHVDQRALFVQDLGNLLDVLFEHAHRVRIGDHQRRPHLRSRALTKRSISTMPRSLDSMFSTA